MKQAAPRPSESHSDRVSASPILAAQIDAASDTVEATPSTS